MKTAIRLIVGGMILVAVGVALSSCTQNSMDVLAGSTHARGSIHVEGYFSDTEANAQLCKVPPEYTPEQAIAYCGDTE